MKDTIIQIVLHKIQYNHQLMQLILSIQGTKTTTLPTDIPSANLDSPEWESKFTFRVYRYQVETFILKTLLLPEG